MTPDSDARSRRRPGRGEPTPFRAAQRPRRTPAPAGTPESANLAVHQQARVIGGELGSLVVVELRKIILDYSNRTSDRVAALRIAAEMARFIGRGQREGEIGSAHDKPLVEMSLDELDALIADSQRALDAVRRERPTEVQTSLAVAEGATEPDPHAVPIPVPRASSKA